MTLREVGVDGVQLVVSFSRRIGVRIPTWYRMVHRVGEWQPSVHTVEQLALGSTFGTTSTAVAVFAVVLVHFRALSLEIQKRYGRSDSGFGASRCSEAGCTDRRVSLPASTHVTPPWRKCMGRVARVISGVGRCRHRECWNRPGRHRMERAEGATIVRQVRSRHARSLYTTGTRSLKGLRVT